jgi:A/G-specific adenine glycosylase
MRIDDKRKEGFVANLISWEKENCRPFPWRKDTTTYRVFISEVLLKRTTSKAADRVFEQFIGLFPDIQTLYKADVNLIEEVLKPIGLYKQRAKGLKETAKVIVEEYSGEFPQEYASLLKIPHIGPYTAGAIQSIGMGVSAPMIDSNVYRVITRAFQDLLPEKPTQKTVTEIVRVILPETGHEYFNWGLIDLGALVCTYRSCCKENCPVKEFCNHCKNRSSN